MVKNRAEAEEISSASPFFEKTIVISRRDVYNKENRETGGNMEKRKGGEAT